MMHLEGSFFSYNRLEISGREIAGGVDVSGTVLIVFYHAFGY